MTVKNPTRTKKFQALLAVLGDEAAATKAWNETHPDNKIGVDLVKHAQPSPEVQSLIDAGFSREDAEKYAAQATAKVEPVPTTSRELAEAAWAKAGFNPVRGRTYANGAIIEAQVRVLKTGKPEVVALEGDRHIKGVAIWRSDDEATVVTQNLGTPKPE